MFLDKRNGPDQLPVSSRIQWPQPNVVSTHGWFRCPYIDFREENLPSGSLRAWHGCKFEALYSILYHGELFASYDERRGHRYFPKPPGIYMHKDATARKAENYIRFIPLCGDGVLWAAKWEGSASGSLTTG